MNDSVSFRLPWPPSVNTYWRHGPRGTYLAKSGKVFRAEAIEDIRRQVDCDEPYGGRVAVSVELVAPDRRARDIDNHGGKAVLDALVHAGLIVDDEQVDELRIVRCGVEPPGCADVTLTRLEG